MKFPFEKYKNGKVEDFNDLSTREKEKYSQKSFENQCIEEAKKLEISIDEIKKIIDDYGGVDKLKEHLETKLEVNVAGEQLNKLNREKSLGKIETETMALYTTIVGLATVLTALGIHDFGVIQNLFNSDNINTLSTELKNVGAILVLGLEVCTFLSSLSVYFDSRRTVRALQNKTEKEQLINKTIDVDPKGVNSEFK